MANIHKTCVECAKPFVFSDSEQNFYRQHNLADPKACYNCRQARKRINNPITPNNCFDCSPKLVRGVVTDAQNKCLRCGRIIHKDIDGESTNQYPVLAHHLRGSDAQA